MFDMMWPIALIVISNIFYHICSKSVPGDVNPYAVLIVTYLAGIVISAIMYFVTERQGNLLKEITQMNWAPYVLGIAIVGLEVGNIYAYRAGWPISIEAIVQSSFLTIALVIVGFLIYKERTTWNKVVGIVICLAGLGILNLK